jgi:hypothetical protein
LLPGAQESMPATSTAATPSRTGEGYHGSVLYATDPW